MKRLSFIVLLLGLMTSSAFAVTNDFNDTTGDHLWSTAANWTLGLPADTGSTSDYVKIQTTKECTLNSAAGDFGLNKVTVAGTTATLKITDGSIGIGNELQVSDVGKTGTVVQTGGSVTTLTRGTSAGKIEVGYKLGGVGYYTISGGAIGFGDTNNVGQIMVGGAGADGATGTFTVQGNAATINTDRFWVGTKDASGAYPGTGTVAFELTGGVSPINVATSVTIDPLNDAACVANLVVTLTDEDVPPPIIPLIITSGGSAVSGIFDTVSGDTTPWDRALEGDTVVLTTPGNTSYTYTLTYLYNADAGTFGNDIALVPEPATVALLGLGSLIIAVRRRKK